MSTDRYGASQVQAAQLQATLRRGLLPAADALGLEAVGRGCTFVSEDGGLWRTLWVQVARPGWRPWVGGAFTMEFQWADTPVPGANRDARTRWSGLLSDPDLEAARQLQASISASAFPLPTLLPEDAEAVDLDWEQQTLDRLGDASRPWLRGEDYWCRYRSPEDASAWAAFFASRLGEMLDRFPPTYSIWDHLPQH